MAYHTSVQFVRAVADERVSSPGLLRKLRLVYLRERCDFLGGLEKNPLSLFPYFGERGNDETRAFGRLIALFFLTYDTNYFSSYVCNKLEINKRF